MYIVDGSGCLNGESGLTTFHGGEISIDADNLDRDDFYGYLVKINKGTRSSAAVLMVEVLRESVPVVTIE